MIAALKIISTCFLIGAFVAFIWALAALTIEIIKEKYNGNKSNR